jgi:trehalose 6-phosphate phosphatase
LPQRKLPTDKLAMEKGDLHIQDTWAFFFDFDGTLVDLAETPDVVSVPRNLGVHLGQLGKRIDNALALISGRRIAEIDRAVSPRRFDVAGVHGAELRRGDHVALTSPASGKKLGEVLNELHRRFDQTGLVIEDKGLAVAVHWRQRPHYESDVLKFMEEVSQFLGEDFRLQQGKAVAELVPASIGKDRAIEMFLNTTPYRNRTPIFFGDDLTDESGFTLVNRRGGISVRVGLGPTVARYRLANPEALQRRLAAWATSTQLDPLKDLSE